MDKFIDFVLAAFFTVIMILLALSMLFTPLLLPSDEYISLTDKQYKNLGAITKEIKKQRSDFIGFSGRKDKMKVIGISADEAEKIISKINIDVVAKDLVYDSACSKLKELGFTDKEIELIIGGKQ